MSKLTYSCDNLLGSHWIAYKWRFVFVIGDRMTSVHYFTDALSQKVRLWFIYMHMFIYMHTQIISPYMMISLDDLLQNTPQKWLACVKNNALFGFRICSSVIFQYEFFISYSSTFVYNVWYLLIYIWLAILYNIHSIFL